MFGVGLGLRTTRLGLAAGLAVGLVGAAAGACGSGVSAGGGSFTAAGGDVEIVVPAGAVEHEVKLKAVAVTEPLGRNYVPESAYDITPVDGWATRLEVRISYAHLALPTGLDESQLMMVRRADSGWVSVATSKTDMASDRVTASVSKLGTFALAWLGCDSRFPEGCTLKEVAPNDMRIGATLEPAQIADQAYSGTLLSHFSSLTPENALKIYSIQNERGVWKFADADAVVDFAVEHDMEIRGHTLVWAQDQFTPGWLKAITDPAELRSVTAEYIETVMGRYSDRIHRWDVVNEPLASTGTAGSGSVWEEVLGPDWIAEVFAVAHAADPSAELWLNEYGTDWVPGKHEALVSLVKRLLDDGVPIYGVGLQTHRLSTVGPSRVLMTRQLRDFADLGLKVAITELDVVTKASDPDPLPVQAAAYARVVDSCLAVPACEEITTWGVTDAETWLNGMPQFFGPTRPLLFDRRFKPKPAFEAVRDALAAGRPTDQRTSR